MSARPARTRGLLDGFALVVAAGLLGAPTATLRAERPPAPQPSLAAARYVSADTGGLAMLPLVEVRARTAGAPRAVAVLLTGDGDWAALVRGVASTLADSGVGVVGIEARRYLSSGTRTAASTAQDVARIARTYLARWGAGRVAIVGYSRGADLAPFVVADLPQDVRRRVGVVAMLGLSRRASFTFHWSDLLSDRARPDDLLVPPALERLRGTRLVCVYGQDEDDSACRDADPTLVERVGRPGAHHFDGDHAALARVVLDALDPTPAH